MMTVSAGSREEHQMPVEPGAPRRRRGLLGRPARAVAVLVLAAAGVVAAATGASAHATLRSTTPRAGAVVHAPPATVQLTFSEAVAAPAYVTVTGPGGRADAGAAQVRGAVVSARLKDGLPAGRYTVAFRVVSDDGHPVEASYAFQLAAPAASPEAAPAPSATPQAVVPAPSASAAPAAPAAAAATAASTGTDHGSHWLMGFAGVAMVLAGGGALLWERRHRAPEDADSGTP
jgi:methionine-rich copper-binding protein CopC